MSATICWSDNPLLPPRPQAESPAGTPLHATAPRHLREPLLVRFDGAWMPRARWDDVVPEGEHVIEWLEPPPRDGDDLRSALQLAATVAGAWIGGIPGALVAIGGNLLATELFPIKAPAFNTPAAESVFQTGVAGNQARLGQPIPKICGRMKVYPDFACQPYVEYVDNEQYYYAIFAVGVGFHSKLAAHGLEAELLDDTPIHHFADVTRHHYHFPGAVPQVVKANVVTRNEVSNQELQYARIVGPFVACGPQQLAASIGIDVMAPYGLGKENALSVAYVAAYREIDQFGLAAGPWVELPAWTQSANTATPQRWSHRFDLPQPMRVEVTMLRTSEQDHSLGARHTILWVGLRSYLAGEPTLNPHVAHYELVMRASDQLSSASQRRIAVIARAMTRTWHPGIGWGPLVFTRTPAWWAVDLLRDPVWGRGEPDSRIDLQSFWEWAQVTDARQDWFDYEFRERDDALRQLNLIARAGRATIWRRNGVWTVARDGAATTPWTAYSARNMLPLTMRSIETVPKSDDPDGVVIEYFDNRQWAWLPLLATRPNVMPFPARPIWKRLHGVTGRTHAMREALYEAALLAWRTRVVEGVTELQGMLPSLLAPVRWLEPDIGSTGDVLDYDGATRVMTLSEPASFDGAGRQIVLLRDDGTAHPPLACTSGADAFHVVLAADPDFALATDDGARERPKYLFGSPAVLGELVRIAEIEDASTTEGGASLIKLTAVVDDPRVHSADAHLLPLPGQVLDPIDSETIEPGTAPPPPPDDAADYTVNLSSLTLSSNDTNQLIYTLTSDGFRIAPGHASGNEWLAEHPVAHNIAVLFEVRVTTHLSQQHPGIFGDPQLQWLSLVSTRSWRLSPFGFASAWIKVEIREAASKTLRASATVNFAYTGGGDGGGGA